LFSFLENSVNNQTEEETLLVLTYELGQVIKLHHYSKRYGETGYQEDMKCEMGDILSMCRMFCEQRKWNFEELIKLGEEHYIERMDDLKKYGIKENLK
jgi:hypothetical protein